MSVQCKIESPVPTSSEGELRGNSIRKQREPAAAELQSNEPEDVEMTVDSDDDIQIIDPPPSAKRANTVASRKKSYDTRLSSTSVTSPGKVASRCYKKHEIHWLLDGNILVQIGEVRFRLHRSTLVKHSLWFRRMIEKKPHDRCTFVDEDTGSTVYCLDSLEIDVNDFVTLLNAIDNAISFVHKKPHLKTIAAILRAADALDFDQFRTFAILELEKEWPSDLDQVTADEIAYAADTVLLARQCSINSIIKRALYELVRAEGFEQVEKDNNDEDRKPTLSKSDYSLLVRAREKLVAFWIQKATPPAQPSICLSPPDSSNFQNCAISKCQTYILYKILVHDSGMFSAYSYDPICGLDVLFDAPWVFGEMWPSDYIKDLPISENVHLCSACSKKWCDTWAEEKKKLWVDMNTWLELDDEEEQEMDDSEKD